MPVTNSSPPNQLQGPPGPPNSPPSMGGAGGNQLMLPPGTLAVQNAAAQAQQGGGQQMAQQQISPQKVEQYHQNLSDMQETLKKLIRLPDDELDTKRIFGAASDLITEHQISRGQRGASAMEVAAELASPDFPKEKLNGQKPEAPELRKYLLNHFARITKIQAMLTMKMGPPQATNQQQPVNPTDAGHVTGTSRTITPDLQDYHTPMLRILE